MATRTRAVLLPPRYGAVELRARGGMGEIYEACDEALGRTVAVKVLAEDYAQDAALRARFKREALAAARLSDVANTVTIYDVGEWDARPYIVMELVRGGTVADHRSGADVADTLHWLDQAGAALDEAHERGVVHRDVKPANLLLTEDGDIRVADFGIASAVGLTSMTETGTVLGTLGYLAPEQAAGATAGPAADRYALAVVAYELLAGRRPFEHETGASEALAASREPVPPISALSPGLPAQLDAIFERALAKHPARRYGSCAELVGELRRAFADDAEQTRVEVARHRATPPPRAWLPWTLALVLLAGAGVAAAALLTRGGDGDRRASKPRAVVRTVTAQGRTVTVKAATPTTTARPPARKQTPSSASGPTLNDTGYSRMQAGDYAGALPLLEQAVARMRGTGSLSEAYASYNLAFTRFALGRCDGVLALLTRSQSVQGHRSEIDALRRRAQPRCG